MSAVCLPRINWDNNSDLFEKEISAISKHGGYSQHFLQIPKQVSIISGIYFLMYGRSVNYVGQSTNVITRCWSHLGKKTFDRVYALEAPERFLDYLEAAFVSKFKPIENGNPNKKTHSCGAYCVRDKVSFLHPDLALMVFFEAKKNNFKKDRGNNISVEELRQKTLSLASFRPEEILCP